MAKAKDQNGQKSGEHLILGGLFIQVVFFAFFVVAAGVFHRRIALVPTSTSQTTDRPWKKHLYVLYVASGLILVRSIFRIAEYIGGSDGVLLSSEWYIYVFDATLMFLCMVVFVVAHPSEIISGRKKSNAMDLETIPSIDHASYQPK